MRTFLCKYDRDFEKSILSLICSYASSLVYYPGNDSYVCNAKLIIPITQRREIGRIRVIFIDSNVVRWLTKEMWRPVVNHRFLMIVNSLFRNIELLHGEDFPTQALLEVIRSLELEIIYNYKLK